MTDGRERAWRIMGELQKHAVSKSIRLCRTSPIVPGTLIPVKMTGGKARFAGLQACASPWSCPICSHGIGTTRAHRLSDALDALGKPWVTGVLTVKHHAGMPLEPLLNAVQAAWGRVWSGRHRATAEQLGVYAGVRGTEVSHGKHGWHPHIHMLLVLRNESDRARVSAWLTTRWREELARAGLTAEWQGNGELEPPRDKSRAIHYLCKAAALDTVSAGTKDSHPFALLERGELRAWTEYELATRGRRALGYLWRARLNLATDDDAEDVHDEAPAVVVAEIDPGLWRAIRRAGVAYGLLRAIESRCAWTIEVLALTAHANDARIRALYSEICSRWRYDTRAIERDSWRAHPNQPAN